MLERNASIWIAPIPAIWRCPVRKRTSNGLTIVGTYAWSKTIDDGNDFNAGARAMDPARRFLERGPSQFDFTHRFTAGFVYELPFFSQSPGLSRTLLSGWQMNGIYILESGQNSGLPGSTVGTPLFGSIRSAGANRNVQFGLKYSF